MKALIDELMSANNSSGLDFFKFAERAATEILYTETDDCESVQIILAVLRGDDELALKMAERFRGPLRDLAEDMLQKCIANNRE
jgi:hypothetical protein